MANTLYGGESGLADTGARKKGVYATYPAAQLKYSTAWDKSQSTQARLFVPLSAAEKSKFFTSKFTDPALQRYIDAVTGSFGYIDFLLDQASEQYAEKFQTIETLSDDYVTYFFGQRAPVFTYSGMLFTTLQDDWWSAFYSLYENVLRGTKLADVGKPMRLRYDSRLISGYMTNFSTNMSASTQMCVNFSFQFLVQSVTLVDALRMVQAPQIPTQSDTRGLDLTSFSTAVSPGRTFGTSTTTVKDTARKQTDTPVDTSTLDSDAAAALNANGPMPASFPSTSVDPGTVILPFSAKF